MTEGKSKKRSQFDHVYFQHGFHFRREFRSDSGHDKLTWNEDPPAKSTFIGLLTFRTNRITIMPPDLPLIDSFGRLHNNLRISVTDRCNIRCFYCMPAEDVQFMEKSELLTFEEIERFVRVAVRLGIDKLRLTGGEPLVRELHKLVGKLALIPGVKDIGLTTNGILLADQAEILYEAGLRRINVSLDALTPEKFKRFTRKEGFEQVIEGIQAAQRAGFDPVKINAVSVRGLTEDEIVPFGHFA